MTLGGWALYAFILCCIALVAGLAISLNDCEGTAAMVIGVIAVVLSLIILAIMLWWYNSTEAGKRSFKTQKSNLEGGIEREVRVYDVDGELIQSYSGKFDVVHDESRILFDDEQGKRHVIYYPTGTVIIDER